VLAAQVIGSADEEIVSHIRQPHKGVLRHPGCHRRYGMISCTCFSASCTCFSSSSPHLPRMLPLLSAVLQGNAAGDFCCRTRCITQAQGQLHIPLHACSLHSLPACCLCCLQYSKQTPAATAAAAQGAPSHKAIKPKVTYDTMYLLHSLLACCLCCLQPFKQTLAATSAAAQDAPSHKAKPKANYADLPVLQPHLTAC
jgi:hypothetical protein